MIARNSVLPVEQLAQRSFQFLTHLSLLLAPARRRNPGGLKEMEFLTLAILARQGTMIVGDIQRLLGVLPAQTSRIVRSLESRNPPLIRCQINPQDKRKINVELTPAGEKQLERFASPRLKILTEMLSRLNDNEREQLAHLLDRLQATS